MKFKNIQKYFILKDETKTLFISSKELVKSKGAKSSSHFNNNQSYCTIANIQPNRHHHYHGGRNWMGNRERGVEKFLINFVILFSPYFCVLGKNLNCEDESSDCRPTTNAHHHHHHLTTREAQRFSLFSSLSHRII